MDEQIQVAYFPIVQDEDQLTDLISRAAWFVSFAPIERIFVFVSDSHLAKALWRVAPGMDAAIAERFSALRAMTEFVTIEDHMAIDRVMSEVSIVLRWNATTPELVSESAVAEWFADKQVHEVDPHSVRMEGANYVDVSSKLMACGAELVGEHRERFAVVASALSLEHEEAVLLATGPSVATYPSFNYDEKVVIVCNTIILDEALMDTVQPRFLVFGDPIFHFGPSLFAARFRESLREAAGRWDFTIVMPLKYYPVFVAAVPELAERTIAIPFRKDREFNFDLTSDFGLKTTANILTFLMVPLGTTFAKRVSFLGCDGRPLSEDGYFWRHNPATQLTDELANIQQVHPAFFIRDYNDYYLEHCQVLEEQLDAGERAGFAFQSLADSHIPALRRRVVDAGRSVEASDASTLSANGSGSFPRLLVIDSTRVGGLSATGQLKARLLRGWKDDAFLQIHTPNRDRYTIARSITDPSADLVVPEEALYDEVAAFKPQVIYYRPTSDLHPALHAVATKVLARHPVPVVTHIMDDWPSRLERKDPERGRVVRQELQDILSRSVKALSISERMSEVLGAKYGVSFEPVANGIDPAACLEAQEAVRAERQRRSELVLRYCGAIARDMTFQTLVDVAAAVDSLQSEVPLRLEVYTMPMWRQAFEQAVASLRGVTVSESVPDDEYPRLLAGADVVVLGYNFDEESVRYIGLSMPNKLPEYLGSGAAVLAVGPREVAGIEYLVAHELASCVTERDREKLRTALRRLATDDDYRNALAARAREWAFDHLDIGPISSRFQAILREAAESDASTALIGPFSRERQVHVDETTAVALLMKGRGSDGVLVDVGAHHGSSLRPFADAGWRVVACEPDPTNRAVLKQKFGGTENVTIDPRAMSDEATHTAAFFVSDESSGISGLHAFRESHRQADAVAVTTLTDLVDSHGLTDIDFLKIDVEGFELNVLRGVPWDRLQPEVVECEFEDRKTTSLGYTYHDLAEYLVRKGYVVYVSEWHPVLRYGIRHEWRRLVRYPARLASPDAWGNILAFRNDPGSEAVRAAFMAHLEAEPPSARAVEEEGDGTSRVFAATAVNGDRHDQEESEAVTVRPLSGEEAARGGESRVLGDASPRSSDAPADRALMSAGHVESAPVLPDNASAYDRFYVWARTRSPIVFLAGQLAMWGVRRAWRYPGWSASYVAVLAMLVAIGFWPTVAPYGPLAWVAAGLLVVAGAALAVAGFAVSLLRRIEQEGSDRHANVRDRLTRAEGFLRAGWAKRDARLDQFERALETTASQVEQTQAAQHAGDTALNSTIDELRADQQGLRQRLDETEASIESGRDSSRAQQDRLGELETQQRALQSRITELLTGQQIAEASLAAKIDEVRAQQRTLQEKLREAETSMSSGRASIAAHQNRLHELAADQQALQARMGELRAEQEAAAVGLGAQINEVRAEKQTLQGRLGELRAAQQAVESGMGARIAEVRGDQERLQQRLDEAEASIGSGHESLAAHHSKLREFATAHQSLRTRLDELQAGQQATESGIGARIDEVRADQERLQQRLDEAEASIGSSHESMATHQGKLRELETAHQSLRTHLDELREDQQVAQDRLGARIEGLEPRVAAHDELSGDVHALRDNVTRAELSLQQRLGRAEEALRSVEAHEAQLRELQAERERLLAPIEALSSGHKALEAAIDELHDERVVLLDIVSTLRKLRPLWEGTSSALRVDEREHGHALLISLLVQEALAHPGVLTGKKLVEVGTTRERDPRQSSTEKLAVFSALMDMRFTSVDMDPANTARAERIVRHLNPEAKIVTGTGEDYLVGLTDQVDYVYLDAFDFEHGQHSPERRARYREVLGSEISNEGAWKMHMVCAAALVSVLSDDGIVVIDDTWTDEDGAFGGKGKLAVPLLLSSGFALVAQTPRAVALRRAPATISPQDT